ncbi:MAG TPA: hypothetical protein VLL52_17580 [Anaerolineae bacterium]|nr:hypothetical protein [Anaerolineae bacterium]
MTKHKHLINFITLLLIFATFPLIIFAAGNDPDLPDYKGWLESRPDGIVG